MPVGVVILKHFVTRPQDNENIHFKGENNNRTMKSLLFFSSFSTESRYSSRKEKKTTISHTN
ncbi:CLUMA_CG010152, isoform A [Clunio marinus]|uniref:CLUMA_CG010152, isoform A n=1 Tax=Clunio marinus TaxID=568069 RepID=A0A1J1I9Y8_9DIPT|nr:CLUMA_CG010152, isoform A [Clunio marinus]